MNLMQIGPGAPDPDVLFIGGGPVGLWTAIQTKLHNHSLKVVILEKHQEYQRKHILNISMSSLRGIPNHEGLKELSRVIKASNNIRTSELEDRLKRIAQDVGIEIRAENVDQPERLKEKFPNTKVFVGADGSHSIVRENIFGGELSVEENLQYIAEVKYEVHGQGRKLNTIKEAYPTQKIMRSVATEHVGSESNGITPITLRLFINKETYEEMAPASFKNPYHFATHQEVIAKKLKENIMTWLNVKEEVLKEQRVVDSEKITVTRLSIYASKTFVKQDGNATWCLVGDAAFGVPFFRSLNNGLLSGTKLAKAISKSFAIQHALSSIKDSALQGNVSKPFAQYASYVRKLSDYETFIARIKNLFIRFYLWFVKISSIVPWQVNKWSEARIIKFKKEIVAKKLSFETPVRT